MIGEKEQILVVDDSLFNANILAEILKKEYVVSIEKSGKDCLSHVGRHTVDLIFLDVVMPEMDGYEVCKRLKQNSLTRDIPIIFVSASEEVENQTRGLELGALDYLVRPAPPAVVLAKAKNYLALKKQREMLEKYSFRDELTGIFNRRYLMEYLSEKWNDAFFQKIPLAVLFMDVDYFKKYNDVYGHVVGDQCLRKLGRLLDGALERPSDITARYGGEEFMIVLPGSDEKRAAEMAKKIQKKLAEERLVHAASDVSPFVTLSIGIAAMVPPALGQEKVLVEMADMALYKAKKAGRNMFRCFAKPKVSGKRERPF